MESGIDVLVVDEDEDMLELTATFLERESDRIEVTTEMRPSRAAELAKSGDFDCVVSDLRMPGMDGIELCRAVREDRPELPFFLFTAADSEDFGPEAEGLDITGVVRKGTGTEHYTDLAEGIEAAVDR